MEDLIVFSIFSLGSSLYFFDPYVILGIPLGLFVLQLLIAALSGFHPNEFQKKKGKPNGRMCTSYYRS
jgi:hypothetical protein